MEAKQEVRAILSGPSARELKKSQKSTWFARIVELPESRPEGDEAEGEAMADWVEVTIEDSADEYSGKFLMRVPKTLHRDLVRRAELEGVSLNQFALAALSRSLGPVRS